MPRLNPNSCNENRITFGTYERKIIKEVLRHEKNKNTAKNITQIATTSIEGVSKILASIPLIVGPVIAAWVAKEVVSNEDVKAFAKNLVIPDPIEGSPDEKKRTPLPMFFYPIKGIWNSLFK